MTTVGIRELRQRASELVRRVAAGETIQVTDRGRLVALLAPPPQGTPLERLRAAGELQEAGGELEDLPAPLELPPRKRSPSVVLARLRRHER